MKNAARRHAILASTLLFAFVGVAGACGGTTSDVGPGTTSTGDGGSGGGDGSTTGEGGGGGDGATTGDGGTGGDGTTSTPQAVNLTFGSCATFTPCGGSLPGTWAYTEGCIDDPAADVKKQCAGATGSNYKGTVKGTVTFTATNVTRNVTTTFSGTFNIPDSCASQVGGCANVQQLLTASGFSTATCTGTSDCTCDVTGTFTDTTSGTYTATGNTLTAGSDEYSYCVTGSKLQYRQTKSQVEFEKGTFSLSQ